MQPQFSEQQIADYAQAVLQDSFCVVPDLLPVEKIDRWREDFLPLLYQYIERETKPENRGPRRYYVTLPFAGPFADPEVFENEVILGIVEKLVGKDGVMCQLATDTPLEGSAYQDIHRDTQLLFPETGFETPPYQIAVNIPLVDITPENGPFELARATHMLTTEEGQRRIAAGEVKIEPVYLKRGDVMIRDVRHLHRGTPNLTATPRPMAVIGYSRRWFFRPEVDIRIPRATYDQLSERAKFWLRFNPIVERLDEEGSEIYQSFAF